MSFLVLLPLNHFLKCQNKSNLLLNCFLMYLLVFFGKYFWISINIHGFADSQILNKFVGICFTDNTIKSILKNLEDILYKTYLSL